MQSFLKKAAIGALGLLLFVAFFWSTLTSTTFWGLALYQTWDHAAVRVVPSETTSLSFATSTASTTAIQTITTTHTFDESDVYPQETGGFVIKEATSNSYYLINTMAPFVESFKRSRESETAILCDGFEKRTNSNPCQSDRAFLDATMRVSTKTAGLFANHDHKNYAATFLLLKAAYLPTDTTLITPIETPHVSGYLVQAPERSIAYLFDQNETGYEIAFIKMTRQQIEQTIAALAPQQPAQVE